MAGVAPHPKLSRQQSEAAAKLWSTDLKALQVVAGAGSGKTSTLIAAVESAVAHGFSAERIAILTFSRRAAHELKERLEVKSIRVGFCGTIHALAYRQLKSSGRNFRILKETAKLRADWLRQRHPQFQHLPDRVLARADFLAEGDKADWPEFLCAYQKQNQCLDFDTMITEAAMLREIAGKYKAVFVDEFQDTSPDQARFVQALKAEKYFVVGDDWQSIYAFRGADVSLTRNFQSVFADSHRVFLLHNYRSAKDIVTLGNRAIRLSADFVRKKLKATRPRESNPSFFFTAAGSAAAAWLRFLQQYPTLRKVPELGSVTVLVRTNAQRRLLERNAPQGLQVMTIHKSKGLEFDHVIVFGIAENSMPHRDNVYDEEVRLLYVALTRARKFLGFVGWETGRGRSKFIPFLMRHCHLVYL